MNNVKTNKKVNKKTRKHPIYGKRPLTVTVNDILAYQKTTKDFNYFIATEAGG